MLSHEVSNQFLHVNRRSFLKLSGLLGLGAASTTFFPASAEALKFDKKRYKISKTLPKIGTFVSMTLIDSSRDRAQEAIDRAFHEIDRLAAILNRFDNTTALARLNHEGKVKDVPLEMREVLARSFYYYKLSRGIFDITVKPVVDLYQKKLGGNKKTIPTEKELNKLLKLVGADKVELRKGGLRFKEPGMGITLDGIAKGYIVDKASKALAVHGATNHLINAGGDIRTMGAKPNKRPWTVAIQDPFKKKNYPDVIHMKNGAIATSGNYEVYFDQEKMFHHIIDPRTGFSPYINTSVSVTSQTTMEADALSTSVFVMAPNKGIDFIDSIPRCECLIVTRDSDQLKSKGWKSAGV